MGGPFPSTRWSLVHAARGAESEQALATLCEVYWYPLYAFARRRGHDRNEAMDLTQGFFAELLDKNYLDDLRPGEGRFRSFLLSALKHYISKQLERERALKRGGGRKLLSLDTDEAEERYQHEPAHDWTPEKAFERSWALATLATVERRIAKELEDEGRADIYRELAPALFGHTPQRSHRETARRLGISEDAVKMALLRLRRRFGRVLREEVAQTVALEEQVDEEIRSLLSALRSM